MKATEVKAGQKFETFYGNGSFSDTVTVTRTTEYSIFVKSAKTNSERREGINTVEKYFQKGLWR